MNDQAYATQPQSKAPSTPLADAVAKVERALAKEGMEIVSCQAVLDGDGSIRVNVSVSIEGDYLANISGISPLIPAHPTAN